MKINNHEIFKFISINLKNIIITNSNYKIIKDLFLTGCKYIVKYSNEFEYDRIIENILKSFYDKVYFKTKYEMMKKIPLTFVNNEMIECVKNNQYLFEKKDNFKEIIKKTFKIHSDQNIVTRFIYLNLGINEDRLPSDLICNIIKKAYQNFSSFWKLKKKGLKPGFPKYLKKDDLFILPYFYHSFMIDKENKKVRLTVGKYISQNYIKITNDNNLVCVNQEEESKNKLYVENKYLIKKTKKKMNKKDNYIIDDNYIEKKNKNIIEGKYVYIDLPNKILDKEIKLIEICPIYNGYKFNINIIYDIEIIEPKQINDILSQKDSISIDLGMRNLMTIYDPTDEQIIIKGNYINSLNGYYNNKIDKLRSEYDKEKDTEIKKRLYNMEIKRKNKINDYFNKLIKYLEKKYDHKKAIIIGYNINWKKNIKIGKKNNRMFYNIPFKKLLNKMKDKFREKIIFTEESYTSKCDALSLEEISKQEKYRGIRTERGLFKSPKGIINADLNGAINIMRKKIEIKEITGKNIFNPKTINIFRRC